MLPALFTVDPDKTFYFSVIVKHSGEGGGEAAVVLIPSQEVKNDGVF